MPLPWQVDNPAAALSQRSERVRASVSEAAGCKAAPSGVVTAPPGERARGAGTPWEEERAVGAPLSAIEKPIVIGRRARKGTAGAVPAGAGPLPATRLRRWRRLI